MNVHRMSGEDYSACKGPILGWSDTDVANFGKVPLQFEHTLHHHPLFSDEALARLLERLERSDYYVNTMDVTSHNVRSRREGEIRDLTGEQILKAVRNGQIWILVMRPERSTLATAMFCSRSTRKLPTTGPASSRRSSP